MILLVVTREARGSSGWQPKISLMKPEILIDIIIALKRAYIWLDELPQNEKKIIYMHDGI